MSGAEQGPSESECLVASRTACSLGVHIGQIDKLPSRDVLSGGIKQTMDGFGEIMLRLRIPAPRRPR